MKVSRHITYSLLIGVIIFYLFSLKDALLFLIGGVFIDIDHYLEFVIKFKKFNPLEAHQQSLDGFKLIIKNPKKYYGLQYFHNLEFLVFIGILSFLFNIHFLILGVLGHLLLDLIDAIKYKITCVREFSIIRYFLRKDRKNKISSVFSETSL